MIDAATSPTRRGTLGGAALGALFLVVMSGSTLLSPTSVDWLMKGDWAPHFFGWHYFRIEPWRWPPGSVAGYHAPLGTSIGLTDAIPLAAYALKPFDAWLPPMFQYIGLWWLLCFTLQGALGARLVSRASARPAVQILGAALFVLLPTLLSRIGHAALCAHWLLLWALVIATRDEAGRWRAWEWAALGLCAGLVQPYLAAMALPLLAAVAVDGRGAGVPLRVRAAAAASSVAATGLGWWMSGMFVLAGDGSLAEGGLGYFSMNLLAPIVPEGWSRVLPELPLAGEGQRYEGFQYLGLGTLALLATAVTLPAAGRRDAGAGRLFGPAAVVVSVLMAMFALSPRVTVGSLVVVDLSSPLLAPLAMFRSSGRFFWPLTYVLLTWAIVRVSRRLPVAATTAVLALAVVLQLFDLHDAHRARWRVARDPAFHAASTPLVSTRWPALVSAYDHVALVPPPQCGPSPLPYEPVARLAATFGRSVNAGVVSRGDPEARRRYCETLAAAIDEARLDSRTLYLLHAAAAATLGRRVAPSIGCQVVDGIGMCAAGLAGRAEP